MKYMNLFIRLKRFSSLEVYLLKKNTFQKYIFVAEMLHLEVSITRKSR